MGLLGASEDGNVLSVHVGEHEYGARPHPKENHVYVDDVHREYDNEYEIVIHVCVCGHDIL